MHIYIYKGYILFQKIFYFFLKKNSLFDFVLKIKSNRYNKVMFFPEQIMMFCVFIFPHSITYIVNIEK